MFGIHCCIFEGRVTKSKNVVGGAKDYAKVKAKEFTRKVEALPQRLVTHAFVKTERQMMSEWQAELVRGLLE